MGGTGGWLLVQDKTFIAHLSALALGGNSEGKGARGFILVSMQA